MQYNSTHELMSEYRQAITALAINYNEVPFLDISHYNPTPAEQQLALYLINIEDLLVFEIKYLAWFHIPNDVQPFNGLTPYMHIIKHKKKGLLEVNLYVQALAASHIALIQKNALKQHEVVPELPPPQIPPYTD